MSIKTICTVLSRALRSSGNHGSPLVAGSANGSRLSSTCGSCGGKGEEETEQSCSSDPERPSGDVHSSCSESAPAEAKTRPKKKVGGSGVGGVRGRSFTSTAAPIDQVSYLWSRYNDMKRLVHGRHSVLFSTPPPSSSFPSPAINTHFNLKNPGET